VEMEEQKDEGTPRAEDSMHEEEEGGEIVELEEEPTNDVLIDVAVNADLGGDALFAQVIQYQHFNCTNFIYNCTTEFSMAEIRFCADLHKNPCFILLYI